jgi:high-affinity iron transporter
MITSLVLSLREGIEAALVIGIVLGALKRTGRSDLNRPLWAGVISASIVSLLAALLLRAVDKELEGAAEQIFEGATLFLAAGILTWMIFWMRRQSGSMKSQLENKVSRAAELGGTGGLFFVAFISVLREGIELALYLIASSLTSTAFQTISGTAIGLVAAGILGYLLYNTTLRLNLQRFFQVTAVILIVFAAGLVAHSVAEFNQAGIIPVIISPIWNLNSVLNEHSIIGEIFSALFGYHGSPSLTEALGYAVYVMVTLFIFVRPKNFQAS